MQPVNCAGHMCRALKDCWQEDRMGMAGDTGDGRQNSRRLFLVRHGRTTLNAAGVLRGRLDPPLDMAGQREAWGVGNALANQTITRVVSSPLRRAFDTATPIAAQAGVEVELDQRLIDRDYGHWAGKPLAELLVQWGSLDAAPDVESISQVRARTIGAFTELSDEVPAGGATVIVTHDAVIQILLPTLKTKYISDSLRQDTGHYSILEQRAGVWRAIAVNVDPARLTTNRS
jgi:broad specificity phosphatase PhoE